MKIFKFGGASVRNAKAVENVGYIIRLYNNESLVIVVSAMGKTTNALEQLMAQYSKGNKEEVNNKIEEIKEFHFSIISDLLLHKSTDIVAETILLFDQLLEQCKVPFSGDYDFHYDQIISYGEMLSTKIIAAYLEQNEFESKWMNTRELIRTNDRWREAKVDWDKTRVLIKKNLEPIFETKTKIVVTQGFLGGTLDGYTATLGREGSDFTASIFAYCLNASDVTIWKDVPGMLNADPKHFDNTILLEKISFKEAIELAYFGASVIHPKTIQPLKRKKIPLFIKSFLNPLEKGTVIQESTIFDDQIPSFIFKLKQVLISLTPHDFSFIVEENLARIFGFLNVEKLRVSLMQNSAVSFSFVIDQDSIELKKLVSFFQKDYLVKCNENLELITIRHYDEPTINRVTKGKRIILEQKSIDTARLVVSRS